MTSSDCAGDFPDRVGAELPPDDLLAPILDDAAARVGVAAGDVMILGSTAEEWRDGSLGCPQPGMMYPQVLVRGYWVVVRAGGRDLDYRLRESGSYRVCEQP